MSCKFRDHIKNNIYTTTFVSEIDKVIYTRPGRTAGTAITRALGEEVEEVSRPYFFKEGTDNWLENITDEEIDKYFKFTFVRNPFSRLVSAWKAFASRGKVSKNFESFVIERGVGHLLYENGEFTNDHWFPQFNYVQYSDGQNFIDFVGKFENLKNDTDRLAGKVTSFSGIGVRGIDTTYKKYYKNGLEDIVANIYKKDLELFGYEF